MYVLTAYASVVNIVDIFTTVSIGFTTCNLVLKNALINRPTHKYTKQYSHNVLLAVFIAKSPNLNRNLSVTWRSGCCFVLLKSPTFIWSSIREYLLFSVFFVRPINKFVLKIIRTTIAPHPTPVGSAPARVPRSKFLTPKFYRPVVTDVQFYRCSISLASRLDSYWSWRPWCPRGTRGSCTSAAWCCRSARSWWPSSAACDVTPTAGNGTGSWTAGTITGPMPAP